MLIGSLTIIGPLDGAILFACPFAFREGEKKNFMTKHHSFYEAPSNADTDTITILGLLDFINTVFPLIIPAGIINFLPFFLRELLEGGNN